jgi:hypothetical protein
LCEKLTIQFWAQHYPGGDLTEVGADYDLLRHEIGDLVILILAAFPPPSPGD